MSTNNPRTEKRDDLRADLRAVTAAGRHRACERGGSPDAWLEIEEEYVFELPDARADGVGLSCVCDGCGARYYGADAAAGCCEERGGL